MSAAEGVAVVIVIAITCTPGPDWNPVSVAAGVIAVAIGALLAAVYLVAESRRRGYAGLTRYFQIRAAIAATVGLLGGIAAAIALRADNRQMFDRVIHRSIPLLAVGVIALAAMLWLARRGVVRSLRLLGAVGVAALIWGWAVAQNPYLLPFTLTIDNGAGASQTLKWLLIWSLIALVLVVPALALLYTLDQRGTELGEDRRLSRTE